MNNELPTDPTPPDSPFLPDTTLQYAWDSVSLSNAMACWRRYYYNIILGLQPKGPSRAIALEFGIAFHLGLEFFHKKRAEGMGYDDATHAAIYDLTREATYQGLPTGEEVEDERPDDADDGITYRNSKVRTRYHLLRALVWYFEHYRDDPAETLILSNNKPAVEVSFRLPIPVEVEGVEVLLCGHIDRAVNYAGSLYVADYKTSKSLSRQFFADFELSHQLTGYTLAGQAIFEKPVNGAIIDGIALQVGAAQFGRKVITKTSGQIDEYLETVQNTVDEAARHHAAGDYPMNTSACYFCQYKELCSKPPEFRNNYISMQFNKKSAWNPLDNR